MGFSGIVKRVEKNAISVINAFNVKKYMKLYTKHLQKCGVNIADYKEIGTSVCQHISILRRITLSLLGTT